jgi:hypothetical protein
MIQGNAASHNVAAGISGGKFDLIVASQRLNRLRLDQREFVIGLGLVEGALFEGVPISFEPNARNRNRLTRDSSGPMATDAM